MGSTPHAHAIARVNHPAEQGLAAVVGLFIDTFVVLTATALVIMVTQSLNGVDTGIVLTQNAFTKGMGVAGSGFVAVCLFFAAFTTIIGWYFFAAQNVKYLVGYRFINIFSVMVIPNIIAVIGLYKLVVKACSDYEDHYLKGEKAHFGPSEKLTGKLARIAVRRRRRRALSQSSGNEDAVSDVLKDGNDE